MVSKQIGDLIEALKINDGKIAKEYEEPPKEPEEVIGALIKIGRQAVEPLLELLKDTSKFSCLYAIKVLGEIRDPRATQPIIEVLSSEDFADEFTRLDDYEQPILALQKIGLSALDPVLDYLKEKKKENDETGICNALRILAGIKDEKSFSALVDGLYSQLGEVQWTAMDSLGEYGDRRAIEHLTKFIENTDLDEGALDSIRKLDVQTYRKLLTKDAERRLQQFMDSVSSLVRDLKYAYKYSPKFEGYKPDNIEIYVREHEIRRVFADLLQKTIDLGLQEAAITDRLRDELYDSWRKILDEVIKLSEQYDLMPEIASQIASKYYPSSLKKEERVFQSIRTARENLISGISKWLRENRFQVIVQDGRLVWGWQEGLPSIKSIVVTVEEPLTTRLWGEAWTEEEASSFLHRFWQFVEKRDFELLGIPRTGRVIGWESWRDILAKYGFDPEIIRSVGETLVYCYVSTLMGQQSIPPSIVPRLEILSDPKIRLIQVSRCRDDPFSEHKARSCRVKLARLTDAGLSAAKEIHFGTLERRVAELTEALSRLPERERSILYYIIGKRVLDGEKGPWDLTVPYFKVAETEFYLPPCFRTSVEERTILPPETRGSIENAREKLSSLGLATASWRHTVSSFTEDALAICPETRQQLSKKVGAYELDGYLQSCQRFVQFMKEKLDLLLTLAPFGQNYGGAITAGHVRWFAKHFEISEPTILCWLQELRSEFPDLISEINERATESTEDATVCRIADGDRYEIDSYTVVTYPKLVEILRAETADVVYLEVLENVKEWLATGKKRPFESHLKIEERLHHPLGFTSCA